MDDFPAFVNRYNDKSERDYIRNLDDFYLPKTQIWISPSIRTDIFSKYKNQEQCKTKYHFTFQNNESIDDWVQNNDFPDICNLLELAINGKKLAYEKSKFLQKLSWWYYLHSKNQQIKGGISNNVQEI